MTTRRPKTPNRKRRKSTGKAASRRSAADLQQQLDRRTRELARARKLLREARQQQGAPDAQQIIAELQRKLDEARAELAARNSAYSERIAYQAAANDVLKIVSASPGDPQPVFDLIAVRARDLCDAYGVTVYEFDGSLLHWRAATGVSEDPAVREASKAAYPTPPTRHLLPGRAILGRAIVHVRDHDTDAELHRISLTVKSSVVVPLMRGNLPIGALHMGSRERGGFSDAQVELLKTFADQAVIAIENARLFNETREALEQQKASADILRVISQSPSDVQPVFQAIVLTAVRLTGCDLAFFLRCDGATYLPMARATPEGLQTDARPPQPIDPDANFPSRAIIEKKTLHLPDWSLVDLPAYERWVRETFGIVSSLYLPLLCAGECMGVLVLAGKRTNIFGDREIALAESFRDQAVIAIENARLFSEVQAKTRDVEEALRYQTGSANILNVIASSPTDVQPVLKAIVQSACELCEAYDAVVILKNGEELEAKAHHGPITLTRWRWPNDRTSSSGRAIADRRPVHLHDVLSDEGAEFAMARSMSLVDGCRTLLSAPLLREGEAIGAIALRRAEVHPFGDKQIGLLQTFADQAVIAIENTRLFNETKEALERQTATADILRVIAGSPTDVQPVFDAIAESARRLLGSHTAVVTRVVGDVVHLAASTAESEAPAHAAQGLLPYPLSSERIHARVARTGQLAVNTDAPNSDLPQEIKEFARTVGWRSMLVVPMLRNEIAIGTIGITRREPGSFNDTTVDLLKTFADQAVIAIENARLFDETKEALARQTATADVLKVIASSPSNLQPVFDTIAERSKALIGAHSTTVVRYIGGMIELAAFTLVSPDADAALLTLFPRRPTAEHDVVLRGEIARIHDAESELQGNVMLDAARARGWRSRLHVPLKDDTGVIGWISITRKEAGGFADKDVELLQTFADQAVIAIQNVELFEEVQARTRELSQSLDDLRSAQDRLVQTEKLASLGQLTAGIAHEIKNPLNFVNNFSALSVELTDELKEVLLQERLTDKGREELDELTRVLKDNLGKVVQHGKRADSIVKNMLLHSREGSGERRSADINALVGESLNLAYHGARAEKAGFNITLEHDLDPEAGAVDLYPQEITRALLNLISNGFYAATRRKAETGDETFEPVLSAGTRNLGKTVEIRIRDNGTGIATEVREKIFNPFFTTKPTGEGTGLGLSMAHDIIVKQHGGRIDVETEPGAFTEFIITLPRDNSAAAVGRKPE